MNETGQNSFLRVPTTANLHTIRSILLFKNILTHKNWGYWQQPFESINSLSEAAVLLMSNSSDVISLSSCH